MERTDAERLSGWIYEVEHGATTMWENWDAIRPDGQVDGCSFNHYAFGCVGDFLYRRVLGIQNAGIGYDKNSPGTDMIFRWNGQRERIIVHMARSRYAGKKKRTVSESVEMYR